MESPAIPAIAPASTKLLDKSGMPDFDRLDQDVSSPSTHPRPRWAALGAGDYGGAGGSTAGRELLAEAPAAPLRRTEVRPVNLTSMEEAQPVPVTCGGLGNANWATASGRMGQVYRRGNPFEECTTATGCSA